MTYANKAVFISVVLAISLFLVTSTALALPQGSAPLRVAKADVAHAKASVRRAEHRLAEARRVAAATALYSSRYGESVGRWVRAARRVGWQWSDIPTLMLVVHTESGGDPNAFSGYYAGLLQFGPDWWSNRWNPYHGPTSLAHGQRAHDANGWTPWPWVGR